MVTWTFDLNALVIGFVLGIFVGAAIIFFVIFRDGGAWSKGFSDGFDLKCNLRDVKNVLMKVKEDGK